jgi:hypothetical protein
MTNIGSTLPAGIKVAFQDYCAVVTRTEERHDCWNSTTKEFIFSILSALSAELKPLRAIKEESVRNYDTVCLGFMPRPTNIVLRKGTAIKGLAKIGGYLFYSQVFNGKILVGISYPCVEELQDAAPNKGLAILDPEEITEEKILAHVEQFLIELTKDESSPSMEEELQRRGPFGFASWKGN